MTEVKSIDLKNVSEKISKALKNAKNMARIKKCFKTLSKKRWP